MIGGQQTWSVQLSLDKKKATEPNFQFQNTWISKLFASYLRTGAADQAKNLRLLAIPAVVVPVDIVTV